MKCPICRSEVRLPSEWAPFCSERCRLIDLGNWASEKYVVSTPVRGSDAEKPPASPDVEDEA
jgi:endogenous inhibitor of DNA gyrase (YacG/DUF329 family)